MLLGSGEKLSQDSSEREARNSKPPLIDSGTPLTEGHRFIMFIESKWPSIGGVIKSRDIYTGGS